MNTSKYSILIVLACLIFFSCRKEENIIVQDLYAIDKSRTYTENESENRIKEQVWFYYKYLSLWEENIYPKAEDFDLMETTGYIRENFTNYFQTASDVLDYLMGVTRRTTKGYTMTSSFPGENPFRFYKKLKRTTMAEKGDYDRYTYFDRGGFISGAVGSSPYRESMGMNLLYLQNEDNSNKYLYVAYVEKHSPAYRAGIRRGARILKLNDDANIDYNYQSDNQFYQLESYLHSNSLKVEYRSKEGEVRVAQLQYSNSITDVVYKDTVVTVDGIKIGYLGFSSFLRKNAWVLDGEVQKTFLTRIHEVFNNFSSQNIDELVVDLRYNGGGYIDMQEEIANFMVPQQASGQLMNTYKINRYLKSEGKDEPGEDFAPVYFNKRGALNLSRVYFLVSEETASASELLINVLVPYMKVYMIGTYAMENGKAVAQNTYGKPVGFFGVPILSSSNQLYVASFQMFNKDGFGDYFHGLVPQHHVWPYQYFYDFADPRESLFAAAIAHMKTGNFPSTVSRSIKEGREAFNPKDYTPVFGNRYFPMMIKETEKPLRSLQNQ